MKKATLIKLICLALACLFIIPLAIACDKDGDETTPTTESTAGKIYIEFDPRGGEIVDGDEEIEIDAGSSIRKSHFPEVEKDGYILEYWAYDRNGEDEWKSRDKFDEDTTLYAIWTRDDAEDNGTTGSTNNDDNVPDVEMITIRFNTGVGYFEDNKYTVQVEKNGYFQGALPTPVSDNLAMQFESWYRDAAFSVPVSRSDMYTEDVTLYARWIELAECSDGSYNHSYTGWDVDTQPTCSKPGTSARYCEYCNDKQIKVGDPAKGHQYGMWQEAFMAKERLCSRPGCGEREIIQYENVTVSILGNAPASQITGSTANFYVVPFTNLINNRWDEGHGEFVGPKGTGTAHVQFNFIEATTLDRIYFKGEGVTSINVFVQYEGEDDFALIGVCGGAATKEATPFVEPDSSKKIVSVKFVEDNPPNGTSKWQEVAFVKIAEE